MRDILGLILEIKIQTLLSILMSRIQNIQSAPDYITAFIGSNREQLEHIYRDGCANFGSGCLGFVCSEEDNKMDVQFMNDDAMCNILAKESWFQLKDNIPEDKKLFYVMDTGLGSVFLIYI